MSHLKSAINRLILINNNYCLDVILINKMLYTSMTINSCINKLIHWYWLYAPECLLDSVKLSMVLVEILPNCKLTGNVRAVCG